MFLIKEAINKGTDQTMQMRRYFWFSSVKAVSFLINASVFAAKKVYSIKYNVSSF